MLEWKSFEQLRAILRYRASSSSNGVSAYSMHVYMGCQNEGGNHSDVPDAMRKRFKKAIDDRADELVFIDPAFFGLYGARKSWMNWRISQTRPERGRNLETAFEGRFYETFHFMIEDHLMIPQEMIAEFVETLSKREKEFVHIASYDSILINGKIYVPTGIPRMSIGEANDIFNEYMRYERYDWELDFLSTPNAMIDTNQFVGYKCNVDGRVMELRYYAFVATPPERLGFDHRQEHNFLHHIETRSLDPTKSITVDYHNDAIFYGGSGTLLEQFTVLPVLQNMVAQSHTVNLHLETQHGHLIVISINDATTKANFVFKDVIHAFEQLFNRQPGGRDTLRQIWNARDVRIPENLIIAVRYLLRTNKMIDANDEWIL